MSNGFEPGNVYPGPLPLDALVVALDQTRLLVQADPVQLPRYRDLRWVLTVAQEAHFLGYWHGEPVFVLSLPMSSNRLDPFDWHELRLLLPSVEPAFFTVAARALQVLEWSRSHRYCGCCGHAMGPHPAQERARVCPSCGHSAYPRINPCVIGVVRRGQEVLLARAHRFRNGMYSALAGFMEVGESAEETLVREVREEVGIEITGLRYFGSQAWPFPSNLMLGFTADYAGGELVLQDDEIADAGFFSARNLPLLPPHGSIARALIEHCLQDCLKETR